MKQHEFRVVRHEDRSMAGQIAVDTEIKWAENELRRELRGDRDVTALLRYLGVLHQLRWVAGNDGCLEDFLASTVQDFLKSEEHIQIVAGGQITSA